MTELNRQTLELIAQSTAEAVIILDATLADLPVVYVNPAYEALTGNSAEEVVGCPWPLLRDDTGDSDELTALRAALGRADAYAAILPDVRKDGTSWLSRVRIEPVLNRPGDVKQFVILQSEAPIATETQRGLQVGLLQRELRRARQKAASLDRVDLASGLLRFDHFMQVADRDFRIAKRDSQRIAVAVFEINDLDAYRQTFGDKAGDSCLRMIGAQISGALRRAGDLCACDARQRIVAMTLGHDVEEFGRVVERIAANVRRLGLHNPRGRSGRYVTVSAGVAATVPADGESLSGLIDEAELQLGSAGSGPTESRASG